MKKTILFFDDYPMHSENALFVIRLRRSLNGRPAHVRVNVAKTVRVLEDELTNHPPAALILDIMAKLPRDRLVAPPQGPGGRHSLTGVALLQRCRTGGYGQGVRDIPIFMRTTRGEPYVRDLCILNGATNYFLVGADDDKLISALLQCLEL